MRAALKADEVRSLPGPQQDSRLREFAVAIDAKPNGELREVIARIASLEKKVGSDTATVMRQLAEGARRETWEVCQLLMLVRERDRLSKR